MSGNNHLQNVDEFELMPFHDDMKDAIMQGIKTATTRKRNYLKKYDPFYLPVRDAMMWKGKIIYILWTRVTKKKLVDVKINHYEEEGFASPQEFEKKWKQIYKSFDSLKEVYYHEFQVLEVDTQ